LGSQKEEQVRRPAFSFCFLTLNWNQSQWFHHDGVGEEERSDDERPLRKQSGGLFSGRGRLRRVQLGVVDNMFFTLFDFLRDVRRPSPTRVERRIIFSLRDYIELSYVCVLETDMGCVKGGYVEDEYFVPVIFGIKHKQNGDVTIYVIVDSNKIPIDKIKTEVVNAAAQHKDVEDAAPRSAFNFSIEDIAALVNGKDLLAESAKKQKRNYKSLETALNFLDNLIENAAVIHIHKDIYENTVREDRDLLCVYQLVSAYK